MTNKHAWIVFTAVCVLTIAFSGLIGLVDDDVHDQTISTQGIKILRQIKASESFESTVVVSVGDMFSGDDGKIYLVREIRRSADDTVFVVVGWKHILSASSYEDFVNMPMKTSTLELLKFLVDKQSITNTDLIEIYRTVNDSKQILMHSSHGIIVK